MHWEMAIQCWEAQLWFEVLETIQRDCPTTLLERVDYRL